MKLNLSNNGVIVFHADGVTKAMNGREEEFGLSPRELIDNIKNALTDFTQGQVQFDDPAPVVLKSLQMERNTRAAREG
jgi:serine phosphatase RsbU (regulator of sigma subunit)